MADVIIMLMQLLIIYGDRGILQKAINEKIERLAQRLMVAREVGKDAASGAAQDVMQPAT